MSKIITREGLKKLQHELEDRKTRIRQEIAAAIKEAKLDNSSRPEQNVGYTYSQTPQPFGEFLCL